jgi:NAD(P)-dependent dehydrogenase (short-subunit alcohol dehydrogenase family)
MDDVSPEKHSPHEDSLRGKRILVTGGTAGIGLDVARTLAAEGASIILCGRDASRATQIATDLAKSGGRVIGLRADVCSAMDVTYIVDEAIAALGAIDGLVNSAGIAGAHDSETLPEDEWDRIVDTNLKGTFLVCREDGRHMLERRSGSIVNIASVAGEDGFPRRAAYGASKAGVIHLSKVLAAEWADRNVRVNAVAPGVIRTEMNERMIAAGNLHLPAIEHRTPMRRRGETGEVTSVIRFLLSDAASYVTGANLAVDGGWLAYGFL